VNISQLRTFLMVVEHGSFSAAARTMHVSQPAITMQVQALETDLGATLLDRQYRRVEATEAGQALIPFAERVPHDVETARNEIEALSDKVTGRLQLAASTTPGQYVLPRLLGSFLALNPEVTVSLSVADTTQVVESVESGEASLGMTGAEVKGAKAHFEEMGSDDLVLIAPPDHALVATPDVAIARVVEDPFIMREPGSGTRLVTEDMLRSAGIDPGDLNVVMELGTSEAIVSAVEGGLGLAVVSTYVAEKAIELGTVARVDCGHFPVSRPFFAVISRGTPTRAADAFVEHLREHLAGPEDQPQG